MRPIVSLFYFVPALFVRVFLFYTSCIFFVRGIFILPKTNTMKTKQEYTNQLRNLGYTVNDLTSTNDICGVLLGTWEDHPGIGYILYLPNSKHSNPSEEKFNKIAVCLVDVDTLEPLDGEGIYLDYYAEIEDFHKRVLNR